MMNEIMKLGIVLIIIFFVSFEASDNVTKIGTTTFTNELNFSHEEENVTFSTLFTETGDDNVTDNLYSTEIYPNETSNETILSTTPKPVEPKINYKQTDSNKDFCLCDLQLDYCDINCCCDKNCTNSQKSTFSDCETSPEYKDSNYCYVTGTLYINRTKTYREISENRLFCIVRSNLPSSYAAQLTQPIKSLSKVDDLISSYLKWPDPKGTVETNKIEPKNISPKFGHNIWLRTPDADAVPLMLPDKFTSNICAQKRPVHFLEDFKSSCSYKFIDESNSFLNSESYFKNISILSLPKSKNLSLTDFYGTDCSKNNCLSIDVFLCDESLAKCDMLKNDTDTNINCHFSTSRNEQTCLFVTQKVKYYFFHNASSELTTANLYLFLSNVTFFLGDSTFEFVQNFEARFFWEGYKQNFSSILSGNPGYILGKYILFGDLTINNSSNATTNYTISNNHSDQMTNFFVFPKNVDGFCVLNNEENSPVLFGYNMQTNCVHQLEFDLSGNATFLCGKLQKQIFLLWQINSTRQGNSGKYIGMFGNSNRLKISEWIEIDYKFQEDKILELIAGEMQNNKLICKNIVQSLCVNIIYAHVDFMFAKHQAKILNVFFETHSTNLFSTNCVSDEIKHHCSLNVDLKTEIMFYDITKMETNKFAKPPNLKFSLPHDFFYPFMMGNQGIITCNFKLLLLPLCVIIISYL